VNKARVDAGKAPVAPLVAIPTDYKATVIHSPMHVEEELGRCLESLVHMFGAGSGMEKLISESAGDGLAFHAGKRQEEIPLEEAARIAQRLGLPVP
jgi:hypothetical protein